MCSTGSGADGFRAGAGCCAGRWAAGCGGGADAGKERQQAAWREDTKDKAFLTENGFDKLAWYGQDEACYKWFASSNWQGRTERLYALAGEVARKMGAGSTASRR